MFELFKQHLLFAKERKCVFFAEEIQYLGHIISPKGMRMDIEKVEAILKWPAPRNLQELKIFLGMSGFYRQYVRDYSKIYVLMTDQLRKKSKEISWGEAQQRSFEKLKVALAVAPILDIVDPNKPFVLETNASGKVIGVVLMQGGCPFAFESKKLDRTQRNYL